jgi:endoglucanase
MRAKTTLRVVLGCLLLVIAVILITLSRPLPAQLPDVTSSTVTLHWKAISGATQIRVSLKADPQGGKMPLATLPGNTTSYTATGLAPAVSLFFEMEADTGDKTLSRNWFIRTLGGPRTVLDNAVREVHLYAPDILIIVLAGGDGPEWQAGPWTLTRANGAQINVSKVSRDSIPVGAPDYQVGAGLPYSDDVLDVDHRIYLSLAEPIGNIEVLSISGPAGVSFTLPFSDRYLETPVVHLNQVGYNPRAAQRYAYFSGWTGDGGALPLANFPATADVLASYADGSQPSFVATLPVTVRSPADAEAGGEVRQIDLSTIPPMEGRTLRVRLPGIGISWPTAISQSSAFQAFYTVTRGLFLNRWGGDLQAQFTLWSRPPDYHQVYTGESTNFEQLYAQDTPLIGLRQVTAGYHDAGNFEQRPMSTVVPQLLMRAFELSPQCFLDRQLNIPESGNGIPDLLDEALWGVSFWEQMQESDGGVREGLQSYRHPWGFYPANTDPLPYWTFSRDVNTTLRVAGVFAQASRLVSAYDAARAAVLRQRAIMAWNYASPKAASLAYRLYAAGELYRLTGDPGYKAAFENTWVTMGAYGAFSQFSQAHLLQSDYKSGKRSMSDYLQGYLGSASPNDTISSAAKTWLSQSADAAVSRIAGEHAHRNPRPERYPMDWGQGTSVVRFLDTVIARLQLGGLSSQDEQQYLDALSLAADYVLGGNPNGLVYITGLGTRNVQEPLHLDSLVFIKQGRGPMPGIPVFGPTASAPTAAYALPALAAFYPDFSQRPEALRYADVRTVPNFNEFSVWEMQAPLAELFAVLLGQPTMPNPASVEHETSHKAKNGRHT